MGRYLILYLTISLAHPAQYEFRCCAFNTYVGVSTCSGLLSCPRFLKVPQILKTRNILVGFPHHICTLGYFGMSVYSVYKVVCKVYLKKIHQVLVEQRETKKNFEQLAENHVWLMSEIGSCRLNLIHSNTMYIQRSRQNIRP